MDTHGVFVRDGSVGSFVVNPNFSRSGTVSGTVSLVEIDSLNGISHVITHRLVLSVLGYGSFSIVGTVSAVSRLISGAINRHTVSGSGVCVVVRAVYDGVHVNRTVSRITAEPVSVNYCDGFSAVCSIFGVVADDNGCLGTIYYLSYSKVCQMVVGGSTDDIFGIFYSITGGGCTMRFLH